MGAVHIKSEIDKGKQLIEQFSKILHELSDDDISELFRGGTIDLLLNSILNPVDVKNFPNFGEFFLANKNRSSLLAGVRQAITLNYSFSVKKEGKIGFVSPNNIQWFDDGVMLIEGNERFAGLMAL